MKNFKTIIEAIRANRDKIECLTGQIEDLENRFERQAAHRAGDLDKVKALAAEAKTHTEEVAALCNDIYRLKIENAILLENARASFTAYALPIIQELCSQYNGKQYGEKTAAKIRDAARERGIGFYFSGYVTKTTLNIYGLNNEGCSLSSRDLDIELYTNNYNDPFVTDDNKLNFKADNVHARYTYTSNPTAQVNKILKAYEAYKAAMEKASKAEKALNDILPETLGHYSNTGYIKDLVY